MFLSDGIETEKPDIILVCYIKCRQVPEEKEHQLLLYIYTHKFNIQKENFLVLYFDIRFHRLSPSPTQKPFIFGHPLPLNFLPSFLPSFHFNSRTIPSKQSLKINPNQPFNKHSMYIFKTKILFILK